MRSTRLACDYYPFHVPPEQWPEDMSRMKECGIDLFRFLCFDWTAIEPADNVWNFGWAKQIMRLAADHGIEVQLTIPTAGPPPWLMLEHPDTTQHGSSKPGIRRDYCHISSKYRFYSKRLAAKIVEELGVFPNVWGYQIDNELGFNISKTPESHAHWIEWLKRKHGARIEDLNEGWGLKFWSRELNHWGQVGWEQGGSPESQYDLKQWYSDAITEFMEDVASVLREKDPGRIVTTNYMANFDMVDYWHMSRHLDLVGYDYYKWVFTLEGGALADDMIRSLKSRKFWRFESGTDNFQPTPWTVLQAVKGWARGMEGDMRFPWQRFKVGVEQVMGGMIDQANRKTRIWEATRQTAEVFKKLPELAMEDFQADVAVVNSWKCGWAFQSLVQRPRMYFYNVEGVYKSLFRLGVFTDVISGESDFSSYKAVVFPSHMLIDEGLAGRIRNFVKAGGKVIAMPMSFTHDHRIHWSAEVAPVGLTDVFGADCREEHNDTPYLHNDATQLGHDYMAMTAITQAPKLIYRLEGELPELNGAMAERWFTWLDPVQGGEVIARYAQSHYQGQGAIVRKCHEGGGEGWYFGTFLAEAVQRSLYQRILKSAGVPMLPPENSGVEVVLLRRHVVVMNFTDSPVREKAPAGKVLFGKKDASDLALEPYGFAVIERD